MTPYRSANDPSPGLSRVASHGAIYTAATLVGRALAMSMVPVYTRYLGPAEYGVLELLDTLDLAVIAAFSTALTDPVLRHVHDAPDARARDAVISTAILALLAAGALVAAVGALASPALAAWMFHGPGRARLVVVTFLSVTFQAVMEVPFAVMRGANRPVAAAAWALTRTALGLALNIALVVGVGLGVLGLLTANLASAGVVATALVALTLRRTGLAFDPAALRRMLAFGWPLVPGALAMIALGHARSYVLNAYVPLAVVGVWAFGYRVGAMITVALGQPLRAAWTSQMYALWDAPDGRGPERYRRAGTGLVALFAWAAAALTAFAPEIARWVGGPGFVGAAAVIPAVAVAYALREVADYFRNGLLVGRNTRALAWIEPAFALFDLALSLAVVPRFGLAGVVVTTPAVFAVYALAMHAAVRKALPLRYEYRRMALCAAIAAALGAGGFALHTGRLAVDLAAKLALVGAYPLLALALVFRETDEREAILALRRRFLRW